jgi:hypothetical protein
VSEAHISLYLAQQMGTRLCCLQDIVYPRWMWGTTYTSEDVTGRQPWVLLLAPYPVKHPSRHSKPQLIQLQPGMQECTTSCA